MPELPTGTVTFLFTDIEGSTALWEQHRDAMRRALIQHDELVERIVIKHDGHVVRPRGEGDSRFAVFARATDAVAAAAALQQALHAKPWQTPTPLRVRMAVHTGEADLREGDYYGSAVNRCARLRAVAHGGQTLVSLTTEQLVRGQLTDGVALRDLGAHRLKDLQYPERIFQLVIDTQPADFPPLKTLDARPNNLPVQLTSFVGREQEVEVVRARLLDTQVHLLTLTATGGSGKTRLALQVAAELLDDFPDGAWFIDLSQIFDPPLVATSIAQVLGVKEVVGQPLLKSLKGFLQDKELLLVLDNFEHLMSAAPLLTELLSAAPGLTMLVTSREALRLYGEHEYPVQPLALPHPGHQPKLQQLTEYAAVTLFVQRAQAVKPEFQVTNENAADVADICIQLDGLPLAIELAAARIKLFPPQVLLSRLNNRLKLLTGGARDRTARQQTLHGAIDWSFQLLDGAEQRLFARLGVFVGGCTVEAIEAVCTIDDDLGLDVLDGLGSLTDKTLIRQAEQGGELRFLMFETIREYAREQLLSIDVPKRLQGHHLVYYLTWVEGAEAGLRGPEVGTWLSRLQADLDNLRAAFRWVLDQRDADAALRLASSLGEFWRMAGLVAEGRQWLGQALATEGEGHEHIRARALLWAGVLAFAQGDIKAARLLYDESLMVARHLSDVETIVEALHELGWLSINHLEYEQATHYFEEARDLYRAQDDEPGAMFESLSLAIVTFFSGNIVMALQQLDVCLTFGQRESNLMYVASVLDTLGLCLSYSGNVEQGLAILEQRRALSQQLGDEHGIMLATLFVGQVALDRQDYTQATCLLSDYMAAAERGGNRWTHPLCFDQFARVAVADGHLERATQLLGVSERLREELDIGRQLVDHHLYYEPMLSRLQMELPEAAFARVWAEGRAMTLEQAVAYALREGPDG